MKTAKNTIGLIVIISVLLIALLIAGCVPQQPPVSQPADQEGQQNPDQNSAEEPAAQEPVKEELSQDIADILAKNQKIKSMQYIYSENLSGTATYYVVGDMLKLSYGPRQKYDGFEYYMIYADGTKGEEYLVCDKVDECKGVKGKKIGYGTFLTESPLSVIRKLDNGQITERTQINNMNTVVIDYTNSEGHQERIWVWDYWGIPLKREITIGSKKTTIAYDSMVINQLSEQDVTLPKSVELV